MKFNAIVGNPPYQEEIAKKKSETNGQPRRKSIFQHFQNFADNASDGFTSLIYPGARWIHRSGKGMEQFGFNQINDPHLEKLIFYPDSSEIFKEVAIADGISIVNKNMCKENDTFLYEYRKNGEILKSSIKSPGKKLIPLNPKDDVILKKVEDFIKKFELAYIHDRILSQKLFGIESSFVEENPKEVRIFTSENDIDYKTEIKLFVNDKAGKAGRTMWFVTNRDNVPMSKNLIDEWQVVVSSANAGGQKRDNQLEIIDNHSAFGRSRVALGTFKTKDEANNFYEYIKTDIVKFMFLMTDESLTSLGKRVPDLIKYSDNDIIDFTKNINEQLNELIGLTKEEIKYINTKIRK